MACGKANGQTKSVKNYSPWIMKVLKRNVLIYIVIVGKIA